jgi:hypothetical protein
MMMFICGSSENWHREGRTFYGWKCIAFDLYYENVGRFKGKERLGKLCMPLQREHRLQSYRL